MQGQTIEMQGQTIEMQGQTIEMQGQTIEMQGQTIEELKRSVTDLKRRLVRHDNYNTPPSQKRGPGWPDAKGKGDKKNADDKSTKTHRDQKGHGDATGSNKPRGGQKGHEGRTRRPKPTEFKEHTPSACPECGSGHLSIITTEKRDITRKECTVKVITTRHTINTCRCYRCPKDIEPETGLPDKGSYDSSIIAEVADDYACRMPFRMIAERMARYGVSLSTGTAYNIMRRLGESLDTPAADIAAMIRRAKILHADETSIHLNGRNVWVWILYDPLTGNALYVIRDNRGAKVLREALKDWDGIIVCDGWTAYGKYRVQRCWSHIIREAKDFWNRNPDHPGARDVLRRLRKIYGIAKKMSKKRSRALRDKACALLLARIDRIVARYADRSGPGKIHGQDRQCRCRLVSVRAGSDDPADKQRGRARTARDSRAQENTGQHKGRRDDDVVGKFLFMHNDVEEQKDGIPGKDCEIRLKISQTT